MKSKSTLLLWRLVVVALLVLGGVTMKGAPVFAVSGSATSTATPSNANPNVGNSIEVAITIDVSGVATPDNALGSFSGTLDWDPTVLAYQSNSGIQAGYTGLVNTTSAATGHIIFNGAKIEGTTGSITVLTLTFNVAGTGVSELNLKYSAMAAAHTFANLLPILTVTNGLVVVGTTPYKLTVSVDPVGGGTTIPAAGDHIYASGKVVNVTATPAAGRQFAHWSGACTGPGACQVTMTADKTVTAVFTEAPPVCYPLTLGHTGRGTDPVADPTQSADCPLGEYEAGETVNLSGAVPALGWRISGWTGASDPDSTADTNSLSMPARAHVVTVNYRVAIRIPAIFGALTGTQADLPPPLANASEAVAASAASPGTQSANSSPTGVPTQPIAQQQNTQASTEALPVIAQPQEMQASPADTPVVEADKAVETFHSVPVAGGSAANPPAVATRKGADGQPSIANTGRSHQEDLIPVVPDNLRPGTLGTIQHRPSMLLLLLLGVAAVLAASIVLVGLAFHRIKHLSAGGG